MVPPGVVPDPKRQSRRRAAFAVVASLLLVRTPAAADEGSLAIAGVETAACPADDAAAAAVPRAIDSPDPAGQAPWSLGLEARRWLSDGKSILLAPLRWDRGSWAQAGAAVGSIALLSTQDGKIDTAFSRRRSSRTDSIARAIEPLGSYAGVGVSVITLGGGLLLKDSRLRDTGRDAIEAELFAAGIVTPILKTAFGRTRPSQGGDGDEYRPLSAGQSFPSGHSTEAFAVASVFAARSQGWVVPAAAYTLAAGVALARMNDRAHFASDVAAGAVIGIAIGQSVVHRHMQGAETAAASRWDLVPIASNKGGIGIGLRLASGR